MMLNPENVHRYIVRKDGKYLVGVPYGDSDFVRYSDSKFDAYRYTSFTPAIWSATVVGGEVMRLNLLTGEMEGGWKMKNGAVERDAK